jgi:hypothetical protein
LISVAARGDASHREANPNPAAATPQQRFNNIDGGYSPVWHSLGRLL